jgi:hypothetical protein
MERVKLVNCNICYESIKHVKLCYNNKCKSNICSLCLEMYIESLYEDNKLVKCIDTNCKLYYTIFSIKSYISSKYLEKFLYLHLNYFKVNQISNIEKYSTNMALINNIKEKRCTFINTIPVAIKMIIDICYTKELKKISNKNKLIIDKTLANAKKRCMISVCNGKLDDTYRCLKCSTLFCKQCDNKITNNHICDDDDVSTLNLIKDKYTPCPKCNTFVERIEGCPSITCKVCHTKFDYITGEEGGHGSINKDIRVQEEYIFLSNTFKNQLSEEELRVLKEFEYKKPKFIKDKHLEIIIKYISTYSNGNDRLESEYDLANKITTIFSNYIIDKFVYESYVNKISEIEELLKKNTDKRGKLLLPIQQIIKS